MSHKPLDTPRAVQRRRAKNPDRVTLKVKRAVHDMIWHSDSLSIGDAARKHNIQPAAFARSLGRPNVQALMKRELDVLRASTRPEAFNRIAALMRNSQVDRIKLDAAKYIDGGDRKSDGVTVNVGVNLAPGYMVDASGFDPERRRQLLKQAASQHNLLIDNDDV